LIICYLYSYSLIFYELSRLINFHVLCGKLFGYKKNMKYLQVILIILQLFVIKIVVTPAQQVSELADAKSAYDLMLTRFKIYLEYYTLDEETKLLYEEALQYGQNNEYEIGMILLEEALEMLKNEQESTSNVVALSSLSGYSSMRTSQQDFNLSIISGLDFNRQEFELGFVESDSTVKEEFSKPYIGLSVRYYLSNGEHNVIDFQIIINRTGLQIYI